MKSNETTNLLLIALIAVLISLNRDAPGIVQLRENVSFIAIVAVGLFVAAFAFMYFMGSAMMLYDKVVEGLETVRSAIEEKSPLAARVYVWTLLFFAAVIVVNVLGWLIEVTGLTRPVSQR